MYIYIYIYTVYMYTVPIDTQKSLDTEKPCCMSHRLFTPQSLIRILPGGSLPI